MTLSVIGRVPQLFGAPNPFRGALVSKNVGQSIPQAASEILIWQIERYDFGNWFASSGDSIFTVPPGVLRVRLSAGAAWVSGAGTTKDLRFLKNGSSAPGMTRARWIGVSLDTFLISPIIEVVPGNTFALEVEHNVAGAISVLADDSTYFGVEAVR